MKTNRIVTRVFTAAAVIASAASCGNVVRSTRAPAILVVNSLTATQGKAQGGAAVSNLFSDVLTLVTSGGTCTTTNPCPTIFNDSGTLTLSLAPKDVDVQLTSNNQVTINRIHISYRRTDGRNTEGVDVPYAYDTATTATIAIGAATPVSFTIVRDQAKQESPLVQLVNNGQSISAIIDVTAYGTDLVGNAVSATGSIGVQFANFGDF